MSAIRSTSLLNYILPVLLVSLGIFLTPNFEALILRYQPALGLLPYLLAIFVLLLALHFNVVRLFYCAIVLSGCYGLLQSTWNTGPSSELVQLLSVSLPITLVLVAWLPDRGVQSLYSVILAIALCVLLVAGVVLHQHAANTFWQLLNSLPGNLPAVSGLELPLLSLLILSIAALLTLVGGLLIRNAFTWIVLLVMLAIMPVLNEADNRSLSLVIFTILQSVMLVSLMLHSRNMAYRDDLTGLLGRRALNEYLARLGRRYVIAMLDVDRFKKFNDRYGHDMGDQVLKMVGAQLASVTGGGKAFRYGGEEFAIVFTGKKLVQVKPHLEMVRETIADYPMKLRAPGRPIDAQEGRKLRRPKAVTKEVRVTVSIGAAERTASLKLTDQVAKAADQALYQAKRKGRNRVCLN